MYPTFPMSHQQHSTDIKLNLKHNIDLTITFITKGGMNHINNIIHLLNRLNN